METVSIATTSVRFSTLHSGTSQKTIICTLVAVRTSDLMSIILKHRPNFRGTEREMNSGLLGVTATAHDPHLTVDATGLDPALPLFATLKDAWKLDAADADFVDVIHTNAGVFGKIEVSGHADFYVNGGSFQPACAGHQGELHRTNEADATEPRRHLLVPSCRTIVTARNVGSSTGIHSEPKCSFYYTLSS
jgi:hypothetical protein